MGISESISDVHFQVEVLSRFDILMISERCVAIGGIGQNSRQGRCCLGHMALHKWCRSIFTALWPHNEQPNSSKIHNLADVRLLDRFSCFGIIFML